MMRRRRMAKDPSEVLGESRIPAKPKPKPPGIIDMAKKNEAYYNYLKRNRNRRI